MFFRKTLQFIFNYSTRNSAAISPEWNIALIFFAVFFLLLLGVKYEVSLIVLSSSDLLGTDIANDGNVSFVFSRFLFIAAAETTRRYRIVFPVNLIQKIARSDADANREREKEVDISGKYIVPSS